MNKTITIALAGFSIIIEEEAYHKLAQYLFALQSSLQANEADEIMYDIEMRIVEILKEKLSFDKREVANSNDVEQIIALMGTPAQINEQTEEDNNGFEYQTKTKKILFRNPDDKVFSGVASGLATYLGMRSIWIRLLFILFSFTLITVIAYIALWILMPVATTTSDKLKMKGQPLNFENIKEHSLEFARKTDQQIGGALDGLTPMLQAAGKLIINLVVKIFRILLKVIGIVCFTIATMLIGGAVLGLTLAFTKEFSVLHNLNFYVNNNILIFIGCVSAAAWITLLISLFLILGIKCFNTHKELPHTGKLLGGLAVIAFIGSMVCISFPIKISAQRKGPWIENKDEIKIGTTSDTLIMRQTDSVLSADFENYWGDIESNGKLIFKKINPIVELVPTDKKNASLEIYSGLRNIDKFNEKISYPVQIQNNRILLTNKYSVSAAQKFDSPYLHLKLLIPSHQTVRIEGNIDINSAALQEIDSIYQANKFQKNK